MNAIVLTSELFLSCVHQSVSWTQTTNRLVVKLTAVYVSQQGKLSLQSPRDQLIYY